MSEPELTPEEEAAINAMRIDALRIEMVAQKLCLSPSDMEATRNFSQGLLEMFGGNGGWVTAWRIMASRLYEDAINRSALAPTAEARYILVGHANALRCMEATLTAWARSVAGKPAGHK